MLEDTCMAPFMPGAVFGRLAQLPAPDYGMMLVNLTLFWVAMFAINILHVSIANQAALMRYGPALKAAVGVTALIGVVLMSFAAAAVLHVFCLVCGGKGGFARSYQAVSTLSLLAPLQALMNGFPVVWAAPTVLGAFVTVVAAERLHETSPGRTRAVFPVLFGLSLLGQWAGRAQIERLKELARAAQAMREMTRQMQAIPQLQPPGGAAQDPMAQAQFLMQQAQTMMQAQQGPAGQPGGTKPVSGLDLLATPYGATPDKSLGNAPAISPQQIEGMRQASANMINSMLPMLSNPLLTKNMPPEQRKQMQELTQMVQQMQADMQSGKPMTPQERQLLMQKFQGLMMQNMGGLQGLPKASPQAPRPAPRNKEDGSAVPGPLPYGQAPPPGTPPDRQ